MNKNLLVSINKSSSDIPTNVPLVEEVVVGLVGNWESYDFEDPYISSKPPMYYEGSNPNHGIIIPLAVATGVSKIKIGVESPIEDENNELVLSMTGSYIEDNETYTNSTGNIAVINTLPRVSDIQISVTE